MKLKKLKKITNNHLMLTSKTNGITIIALVITIIIIIILATITINITLGEGGLIDQAKQSKEMAEDSTNTESALISNLTAYLEEEFKEPVTPPEDNEEIIEINQAYLDLNSLSEEQRNIEGYYLIKSNCNIVDSSSEGVTLETSGDKIIEVESNVNCSISGGNYNGNVNLDNNSTLTLNCGTINGDLIANDSTLSISNGAKLTGNLVANSNSEINISGGEFSGKLDISENSTLKISGGYFNDGTAGNYVEQGCALLPSDKSDFTFVVSKL